LETVWKGNIWPDFSTIAQLIVYEKQEESLGFDSRLAGRGSDEVFPNMEQTW
jgi:hypothetical protein